MAPNRITLYYDIVSPWSHVAFVQLTRYSQLWSVPLDLQPINLGYVMKTAGNKPPITVPNKGRWMGAEMVRAEHFYGVSLSPGPQEFPFNSFPAMCVLRALKKQKQTDNVNSNILHQATAYLFQRVWSGGVSPTSLDDVAAELTAWSGLSKEQVDQLIAQAGTKEARSELNGEAVKLVEEGGAFGAPWIVAHRGRDGADATFFGSDRMEHIAAWLELPYKGPLADGRPARL